MNKPEVVAIIPARGGSKGLPRKNVLKLCGKPLIVYSIEAALAANCVSRVIVTTDDEEIANVSEHAGAEVPFIRPASLGMDRANLGAVLRHAMFKLKENGYEPDVVVTLFPTHLFRTPKMIDFMVSVLFQGYQESITVRPLPVCQNTYCTLRDGCISPIIPDAGIGTLDCQFHRRYGIIHAQRHDYYFSMFQSYLQYITDPISLIDIDTIEDFRQAEYVIENGKFDFGVI